MKKIAKYMLAIALVAAPAFISAQTPEQDAKRTNTELSEQYNHQIDALEAEIKANKANQKAFKTDAAKISELKTAEAAKTKELEALKAKKKTVDAAIKADKQNVKAQKTAQQKQEKAQEAQQKAKATAQEADAAVKNINPNNLSNTQLSEQFGNQIDAKQAEIKANKASQKAFKDNASKLSELKAQEVSLNSELKDLKSKKDVVDKAIKASKQNVKAQEKAQDAQQDAEQALKKAKEQAKAADKAVGRQ